MLTTPGVATVVRRNDRRRRRRINDAGNVLEDAGVEELIEDETAGGDGRPAMVVVEIGGGSVEVEAEATGRNRRRREVGLGLGTTEGTGGAVVGKSCLLGSVECA